MAAAPAQRGGTCELQPTMKEDCAMFCSKMMKSQLWERLLRGSFLAATVAVMFYTTTSANASCGDPGKAKSGVGNGGKGKAGAGKREKAIGGKGNCEQREHLDGSSEHGLATKPKWMLFFN